MDLTQLLPLLRSVLAAPVTREELERRLGVALQAHGENEFYRLFRGSHEGTWFGRVDYREQKQGSKRRLVLYVAADVRVPEDAEPLEEAFGAKPRIDVNPHVRPGGSYAHEYPFEHGRILFSYDRDAETLRLVSIRWE